ncbi:hypothetical protein DFP74_3258 [Nocardiopsis sp. Huas11]|nr:hypothetical protein DFP74_3258 [Nocardiopsis sp. Huas11]
MSGQTGLRICACTPTQLSFPVAVVTRGDEVLVLVRIDLPVGDILADAALLLTSSEQVVLLRWLEAAA